MKHHILWLSLIVLVISACHHQEKPKPIDQSGRFDTSYAGETPIIISYDSLLSTLNDTDLSMSLVAYKEYQHRFADQSPQVCDTALHIFLWFQYRLNADSAARRLGDTVMGELYAADHSGKKLSPALEELRQKFHEELFTTGVEEDNYFLIPSWQEARRRFSGFVSEPMKEILAQNALEEEQGFQSDAALDITPEQLVSRTVWWERFLDRNPNYIYTPEAKSIYKQLLSIVERGTDNTQVNLGDDILTPYFDAVYSCLRDSFPATRTNQAIASVYQAYQQHDKAALRRFADSLDAPR